jgi:Tol biopolymer transport system component/predicted Ser/Thr protein kinase
MTPERHRQIGELFNRILTHPRDERARILDEACKDDPELRWEVESLLQADAQAGNFIDTPAIDIAARLLSADAGHSPTEVGRYRILSLLGRGGMGKVYLAEDPALGRRVAIKLLHRSLTKDARTVQRFEHEARAASSLNHPNIVTIHETGEVEASRFIVMEFVEGRPLSDFVDSPMPAAQLIPIARQLAQALTVAHAAGIVHRDIKPANVMLRTDGYVKLLDFGVARLTAFPEEPLDMNGALVTGAGAVIGTPRYMSPEQIRGEAATSASDVFALGAVLYELATGQHASEPEHAAAVPAGPLTPIVRRMLNPDPSARPSASEVETLLGNVTEPVVKAPGSRPLAQVATRRWLGAGAGIAAVALAVVGWATRGGEPVATPVRFQITPPAGTAFSPSSASLALSPDGTSLAFTASQINQGVMGLWLKPMDAIAAKQVPSVKTAGQLFWLPDSRSLAFADTSAKFALKVVDTATGSVRPVENAMLTAAGVGSAGEASLLATLLGEPVVTHIPLSGGPPKAVSFLDAARGETGHRFPVFLPDGRHFIFLASSTQPEHDGVAYVGLLDSNERRLLFKSDSQVVYAHPGFLLYMLGDTLLARPFDAGQLRVTGEARPIGEHVERNTASRRGAFTVSQTGVLAYRQFGETQLVWRDRTGRHLGTLGPPGHWRNPALSPDEKTVAIGRLDGKDGTWDVWTIDVASQALTRVTVSPLSEDMPLWAPDGASLAFKSEGAGSGPGIRIYRQSLAAGGQPVLMETVASPNATLHSWGRQGVLYSAQNVQLPFAVPSVVAGKASSTPFWEPYAQLTPDEEWLAYGSNDTGAFEIYVMRTTPENRRTAISVGGGTEPLWRKDARELFYVATDRQLMALPVTLGREFHAGAARPLFQSAISPLVNSYYTRNQYVVTGDGQRFLINEPTGKGSLAAVTVVLNWPALLRRE